MIPGFGGKLVRKLRQLKTHGPVWILRKIFRDHIYHSRDVVILERDLAASMPFARRKPGRSVRMLHGPADLATLRTHFPSRMRQFRRLMADGAVCVVNEHEGAAIAYFWLTDRGFYDRYVYRHKFDIAPDQIYQFAGVILPEFRGTMVVIQTQLLAWNYFRDKGFKRVVCAVETDNQMSMRVHFRLGFEEVGELLHWSKLLGFRWSRSENYQGLRFPGYKRPRDASAEIVRT